LGIAGGAQAVLYPLLERPSGRNSDQHSDRCSTMHPGGPPAALPSCMSARKRPRRSGPASPPIEPTADSVPADDAGLQHQFRDVQARKQSKADELRSARAKCASLEARCAVLSGEMEDLTRQENTLRAQVATEHNSTQSKLVQLPNEVRQLLLGMLGVEALGRLAATSKDWQHSIADPMHWQVKVHTANATCLCRLMVHLRATRVDTGLATICCQRVRKIGDGGKGKMTAEGTAFNSVGGCKALVAAMRSHAAVANLQAEGCRAVMVLCRGDEGKAAMLAAGGAEAVVGALQAHVGVAAVQEGGCRAVCNLAGSDESEAAVLAAGGAEAVVGALRAHGGVAAVQEEGCAAVCNLACSDEGKVALVAAGGAEAVVGALRAHVGVAAVQEGGCRAVCNLAGSDECEAAVLSAGGAEAVVGALRAHGGVAAVQEEGCAAAWALACSAEGRATLRRLGAEELAQAAKRNHPTHGGVQERSAGLLRTL
jgi:hypothetical protein